MFKNRTAHGCEKPDPDGDYTNYITPMETQYSNVSSCACCSSRMIFASWILSFCSFTVDAVSWRNRGNFDSLHFGWFRFGLQNSLFNSTESNTINHKERLLNQVHCSRFRFSSFCRTRRIRFWKFSNGESTTRISAQLVANRRRAKNWLLEVERLRRISGPGTSVCGGVKALVRCNTLAAVPY